MGVDDARVGAPDGGTGARVGVPGGEGGNVAPGAGDVDVGDGWIRAVGRTSGGVGAGAIKEQAVPNPNNKKTDNATKYRRFIGPCSLNGCG